MNDVPKSGAKRDDSTATFVKNARAKLKLTQAQFAALLGIERRSIMRYERGGELPTQARLAMRFLVERYIRKHRKKGVCPLCGNPIAKPGAAP